MDRFGSILTLLFDKGDEFRWLDCRAQGSKSLNVLKTFWHHQKARCQHASLLRLGESRAS